MGRILPLCPALRHTQNDRAACGHHHATQQSNGQAVGAWFSQLVEVNRTTPTAQLQNPPISPLTPSRRDDRSIARGRAKRHPGITMQNFHNPVRGCPSPHTPPHAPIRRNNPRSLGALNARGPCEPAHSHPPLTPAANSPSAPSSHSSPRPPPSDSPQPPSPTPPAPASTPDPPETP